MCKYSTKPMPNAKPNPLNIHITTGFSEKLKDKKNNIALPNANITEIISLSAVFLKDRSDINI